MEKTINQKMSETSELQLRNKELREIIELLETEVSNKQKENA